MPFGLNRGSAIALALSAGVVALVFSQRKPAAAAPPPGPPPPAGGEPPPAGGEPPPAGTPPPASAGPDGIPGTPDDLGAPPPAGTPPPAGPPTLTHFCVNPAGCGVADAPFGVPGSQMPRGNPNQPNISITDPFGAWSGVSIEGQPGTRWMLTEDLARSADFGGALTGQAAAIRAVVRGLYGTARVAPMYLSINNPRQLSVQSVPVGTRVFVLDDARLIQGVVYHRAGRGGGLPGAFYRARWRAPDGRFHTGYMFDTTLALERASVGALGAFG